VREPKAVATSLGSFVHVAELQSRSFHQAVRPDKQNVLVHLGKEGMLVETPLPARASEVARESATRLRFLADDKPPLWFTVDLSEPDAPAVGAVTPAPSLAHRGTLKAFASDGERALLGRYQVDYDAKPTRYFGETALYSVPDGKRTSPALAVTAWSAACRAKRCVAAASGEGLSVPVELHGVQDSGGQRLATLENPSGWFVSLVLGEHFVVAHPGANGLSLVAVDLATWAVTHKKVALRVGWMQAGELSGRSGLWLGPDQANLAFLPISAGLEVGEPESLPRSSYSQQLFAPLADGLLRVEQTIGHGMIHSPTDLGIRRYFRVWSFEGRAGLLRPSARGWRAEPTLELPHDGDEGRHSNGPSARPLVRPGWAAVVVDDSPGGKSEVLLVGRPCE